MLASPDIQSPWTWLWVEPEELVAMAGALTSLTEGPSGEVSAWDKDPHAECLDAQARIRQLLRVFK